MSTGAARGVSLTALRSRAGAAATLLRRALFGDRLGVALFLTTLVLTGLTWRIGFFINDTYTLANALVALADGSLALEQATYGRLGAPGTVVHEGRVYGRNYGQVALALVLLGMLRAATAVADPGLVFPALWSLVVLALAVQVGRLTGRRTLSAGVGAAAALGTFAVNAALAEPLAARLLPVAALQLGTLLAAAFVATTTYRLLARMHGRRVGAVAGAAAVLGTPVAFWAAVPKRHVTVTALLLGVVYAFYRSRGTVETDRRPETALSPTGFRALAYGLVGLLTWVHAGEGFVVFLALVLVDVPTAPSNDARTLAVVGLAFFASLVPFFLTNALLSGDPVRPPRMLPIYGTGGGGTFSGASGAGTATERAPVLPPALRGVVSTIAARLELLLGPFAAGARAVVTDPESLYRTFVRAGYSDYIATHDNNQAINLTVLESAPVTAGVVALVALSGRRVAAAVPFRGTEGSLGAFVSRTWRTLRRSQTRSTDAFVAVVSLLFTLVYMPRLPLFAQVTVRYLLPVYVVCTYALARASPVRRALTEHGRTALWTYLGGVLLGAQLFFVVVTLGTFGRGGALQLHAVVGLAVAAAFALAATASVFDDRADRVTAALGALAAALGTNLTVLSALVYFQYGPYALPAVDWLADLLAGA